MPRIIAKKFQELNVGDKTSFDVKITNRTMNLFGQISGDKNPLHTDKKYSKSKVGHLVVYGMIAGTFFSRLVGMHLPGKYSLYLSQNLKFHKPIKIGTKLLIEGEILEKTEAFKVVKIKTSLKDFINHETLVSGEAMVKLLE